MPEIVWYYPERLDEIPELLQQEGVAPHGGGTGLIRNRRLSRLKGIIDLSRLPLTFAHKKGDTFELGAALTYAETAAQLTKWRPGHILAKALSAAASTPLRNRITLGGSIAFYPSWSDLLGPLIALEAELVLVGREKGRFPILRYIQDRDLRQGNLITGIRFAADDRVCAYHRETRTAFDYPAFTLTILIRQNSGQIERIRIILSGVKGKYKRLDRLEELVRERGITGLDSKSIADRMDADFAAKRLGSGEYLKHLAVTAAERGLYSLSDGKRGKA